ncbi:MAG: addiction module protein [Fidelibacterota bacterium]
MTTTAEKIYEQALELPAEDRMELIDKLLISENLPTQQEINQAWSKEVERRIQEIENGDVELIPGDVVFERINKKYKK